MAIEQNYFIGMHHQAGVHFEIFNEVKFQDILQTGGGTPGRRLNRDCPRQTGTYGSDAASGPTIWTRTYGLEPVLCNRLVIEPSGWAQTVHVFTQRFT